MTQPCTIKRVPRGTLLRVMLRAFLLQASWNFERMQNLGALYVIAPALRHLYRGEDLSAACARHLAYFNTHPYMASAVFGTTVALEETVAAGQQPPVGPAEFKEMVMIPFAAMGDALFWGGIRPLAAVVALFFAFKGSLWAPFVFLLCFNLPHLWTRVVGFRHGYGKGVRLVDVVQGRHFPDLAIRAKETTVVLLGGLGAYLTFMHMRQIQFSAAWGFLFPFLVVLLGWLARKGVSNLVLILVSTLTLIGLGLFL
ncbi:PTS system mannose/fructose/sorbose family transporter subunit IID [Geoalkalibacter subterraneus]|uniref:PTS system mannose/fructose/sorbose family transporter subunit IID n=1 Tax=Geoalkalibacter subterraneus TaxID=483547 RepID=UPI0006950E5A|nr:PTS system mannose/fructose/sorbose family transporter subunit IID [Geoalkalibacter subterraneus]